jgi:type III restriction enzyme
MMAHFWESRPPSYEVQVSRGFTELKPATTRRTAGQPLRHFRDTVDRAEPDQADAVRRVQRAACTRCRSSTRTPSGASPSSWSATRSKWFKPAKGQFQIYYKLGTEQPEYIPDFVAETETFWSSSDCPNKKTAP